MKHIKKQKEFIKWLSQFGGNKLPEWNPLINIVGVRDDTNQDKDIFNDRILILLNGDIYSFIGTTDPGKYWTDNAKKEWGVAGVAHLMEGWYPLTYRLGNHMKELALVQYGNSVTVWRDVDKDFKFDPAEDTVETGYFGINIHYTKGDPKYIGRWSAGCQVVQKHEDWVKFLELVSLSGTTWFNYLLMNKNDLSEAQKDLLFK